MKIEPIRIAITDTKDAINMYVTASDSWGNEDEGKGHSYEAIAVLTDEDGIIKRRLNVSLYDEAYNNWDGSNTTILDMFLLKYPFLKIIY
jgi:hypothetical protein